MTLDGLTVKDQNGAFLGRLSIVKGAIQFSKDTDALFKNAIEYLLAYEPEICFKREDGKIVREELFGLNERKLSLLGDYLRYSHCYQTELRPSVESVFRIVRDKEKKRTHTPIESNGAICYSLNTWQYMRTEAFLSSDFPDGPDSAPIEEQAVLAV